MAKLRGQVGRSGLLGRSYRVAFTLYSEDGERAVDVLEFENGETFLDEQERVSGGAFVSRHSGSLVGPFDSPAAAETFIVTTDWFRGS